MLRHGAGRRSGRADREWRELYSALDCAALPRSTPSTPPRSRVRGRGPPHRRLCARRHDGTAAWLAGHRQDCGVPPSRSRPPERQRCPPSPARCRREPIKGRITLSGYEGSELLVARLLIESGADVPMSARPAPRRPGPRRREWLEAKACKSSSAPRWSRTAPRWRRSNPTSPSARRRGAEGQGAGIPALYFTNLISARPLMGPAGAGSLAQVVNAAIANKDRLDEHEGLLRRRGQGDTAGIWEGAPKTGRTFRAKPPSKLRKGRKNAVQAAAAGGVDADPDHDRAGGYWGSSMPSPR
jgi:chlorophyllide a reductase subunit Y